MIFHRHALTLAIAVAGALALPACSHLRKAPQGGAGAPGPGGVVNYGEGYGPQPVPEQPSYGPEPVLTRPIVLVLGPGLARGFAHAGVLRALADAKIPIGAIVATDMGSLIGAMYAVSGSTNAFDFALLRLKGEMFYDRPGVLAAFGKERSDGDKLESTLRQSLGAREFKDAKVPLKVLVLRERSGDVALVDRGALLPVVRSAVANPLFMKPGELGNVPALSALLVRPYPVSEAKALGLGMVVAVDALDGLKAAPDASKDEQQAVEQLKASRRAGERELASADLVLSPNLKAVGALDFDKRSEAIFQGKASVQQRLGEIRHLVGLPPEGLATE